MGARQSRVNASSPGDVNNNLTWALNESVHWEEECTVVKMILSEAHLHSSDDSRSFKNKIPMDQFARYYNLLHSQSSTTLARIDAIVDKSNESNDKEYPSAHPVHAGLASRSFASAATEHLTGSIASVNSDKSTVSTDPVVAQTHHAAAQTGATTAGTAQAGVIHPVPVNTSTGAGHPVAANTNAAALQQTQQGQVYNQQTQGVVYKTGTTTGSTPLLPISTVSSVATHQSLSRPVQSPAIAVGGLGGEAPHTLDSRPSNIPIGTTASVISGPVDMSNSNTASPPAVSIADLPKEMFTADRIAQQERVEIAAKFLFVYSLILKLVASAEHCYKLKLRGEFLQTSLKSKTIKQLDQAAQTSLQDTNEATNTALRDSLLNFDHAREAYLWLRRDYELIYAQHRCHDLLRRSRQLRNSITYSDQMYDSSIHAHSPNQKEEDNDKVKQLNGLIEDIERRKLAIERNIQHNEQAANAVALNFLDSNNNGMIRPEAVPELSHRLFSVLDPRERGFITKNSVNRAILKLSNEIDQEHQKVTNPSKDGKPQDVSNQNAHNQLQYDRLKQTLREINWFLHQTFVRSVFDSMDSSIRRESVDLGLLQRDLTTIEGTLCLSTNPIKTDSESGNISWMDQASMVDKQKPNLVSNEKTLAVAPVISSAALKSEHEPQDALSKNFENLQAGQQNKTVPGERNTLVGTAAPAAPALTSEQADSYKSHPSQNNVPDQYGYRSDVADMYSNNRYVGYGNSNLNPNERDNSQDVRLYNTGADATNVGTGDRAMAGSHPAAGASEGYATAPGTSAQITHPDGASGVRNVGYVKNDYNNDGLRGYYGTSGGYAYNNPQPAGGLPVGANRRYAYNPQSNANIPLGAAPAGAPRAGAVPNDMYDKTNPASNPAYSANTVGYSNSAAYANTAGVRPNPALAGSHAV